MLPVGQHISITIRHFDLWQNLSVDYLVLRNNTVFVEQKSCQGINLVWCQRALFTERHPAIDVIPYRGRVWRVDAHYSFVSVTRCKTRRLLSCWRGGCGLGRAPSGNNTP